MIARFISKLYQAPALQRRWFLNVISVEMGSILLGDINPPKGKIDENIQYVLDNWDDVSPDDREKIHQICLWDITSEQETPITTEANDTSLGWIRSTVLRNVDAILCVASELQQQGEAQLLAHRLTDTLNKAGRPIRNVTTFIRHLAASKPPLVEILSETPGRNGVVFCLSKEGLEVSKELKKQLRAANGS